MDRLAALRLVPTTVNGIDFVEIANLAQTELHVHFVNPVAVPGGLDGVISGATITGGDAIPTVAVLPITSADWTTPGGGVLRLRVAAPGDFSSYTLQLLRVASPPSGAPILDPYFDHVAFSFKAGCATTVDCDPPAPACPAPVSDAPPIDYLAKDFQSFRGALLDFSALRYPGWQERSEGDFGVMFAEALSSVADDLSYLQDRIAAEAYLGTATERRSVVRLARLVDYEPMPATAAKVQLQISVTLDGSIAAGTGLSTQGPDGQVIAFEVGTGLADTTAYAVQASWSALDPYWWDDSLRCLHSGATQAWVVGHGLGLQPGQQILIRTQPEVAGDPDVCEVVTLATVGPELVDPLFGGAEVTTITWQRALVRDHDLTRTKLSANLVPATQGRRFTETFGIGSPSASGQRAIERTGPNGTTQYLYTLGTAPLAWLPQAGDPLPLSEASPEIHVTGSAAGSTAAHLWTWQRSLLDAGVFDEAFTVDPVRYTPVGEPLADGATAVEYDGDAGDTIRFGDGAFGVIPDTTASFTVLYRVGGGAAGNIAAGTTFSFDPAGPLARLGATVVNPFAATGGSDAESIASVQARAPYTFRTQMARAPLASDFERFALELPWVQRANTTFRSTGSWLVAFTAPDPVGMETLSTNNEIALLQALDRVRLAGRESQVRAPQYLALDVAVVLCAKPDAFKGDVQNAVLAVLGSGVLPNGSKGFFHPDNFTFGKALRRGTLEAAVQRAAGVHGVLGVFYRPRWSTGDYQLMPPVVTVASWEIVQVDSNPSRPERGTVQVFVEGGK